MTRRQLFKGLLGLAALLVTPAAVWAAQPKSRVIAHWYHPPRERVLLVNTAMNQVLMMAAAGFPIPSSLLIEMSERHG